MMYVVLTIVLKKFQKGSSVERNTSRLARYPSFEQFGQVAEPDHWKDPRSAMRKESLGDRKGTVPEQTCAGLMADHGSFHRREVRIVVHAEQLRVGRLDEGLYVLT